MVFRPAQTFNNPAQGANAMRGFPAPGSGAQTSGEWSPPPRDTAWAPERPTKGVRAFLASAFGSNPRRGFPAPEGAEQARPAGSVPPIPEQFGGVVYKEFPYYSRGDGGRAPQLGQVTYNPIGAGVVAPHRVQASYGPAAQYENGVIFWTSQAIPTSVNLQGLTDPSVLAAVLGPIRVQAAVRVNG